jgi:hypothetical protein
MRFNGNAYVESPYTLERQSTSVKVGSVKIVDFTAADPSAKQTDAVKYGPYSKIAPFTKVRLLIYKQGLMLGYLEASYRSL